jgi:hypothetical protein
MPNKITPAFLLFSFFLLLNPCYELNAKAIERCHMCGMDASRSQTEFIADLSDGSREHACCLHCVYLLQSYFDKDRSVSGLQTKDFSTGEFIDAKTACYLYKGSIIPKGSMAPFFLAFSAKGTADKYKKKYGGQILDFAKAMDAVLQLDRAINKK